MTDIIWGALSILFGLVVTGAGWRVRRNPAAASQRMQDSGAAQFQPGWAVRTWGPDNMRSRAVSMLVGGLAFVFFGSLLLSGAVDLG